MASHLFSLLRSDIDILSFSTAAYPFRGHGKGTGSQLSMGEDRSLAHCRTFGGSGTGSEGVLGVPYYQSTFCILSAPYSCAFWTNISQTKMLTKWHDCFSPSQEAATIATSWVTCFSCSAWSAGWCTAAFAVSRDLHSFFARLSVPLWFPFLLPCSDWRIHCSTSYAKDGFWLYLTQIASCSPWMLWMFLNSVFHFMWVAVLIMCQLYQVWIPKNICNGTVSFSDS